MSNTATASRTAADIITVTFPNGKTKTTKGKIAARCHFVIVAEWKSVEAGWDNYFNCELRSDRTAAEAVLRQKQSWGALSVQIIEVPAL